MLTFILRRIFVGYIVLSMLLMIEECLVLFASIKINNGVALCVVDLCGEYVCLSLEICGLDLWRKMI